MTTRAKSTLIATTVGMLTLGLLAGGAQAAATATGGSSSATATGSTGTATTTGTVTPLTWKCRRANGSLCTNAEMASTAYKQVVIFSAGFQEADRGAFWQEFDNSVNAMIGSGAGTTWSVQYKDRIFFVGYFTGGGALGASNATFGATVPAHPIRGKALSLDQSKVYQMVGQLQAGTLQSAQVRNLRPFVVGVLFNTLESGITANASPPSFVGKAYGIAKWGRRDLIDRPAYITTHELAHAGLNFVDEYIEAGFETLSIRQLDVLTPLALLDGSWGGFVSAIEDLLDIYDYNISEILADNGSVNVSLRSRPATVGGNSETFPFEGGMFFGRGAYHQGGNLMDSNRVIRGTGDGQAMKHSASQQPIVNMAFSTSSSPAAPRANDRLRNAGPTDDWFLVFGYDTTVMMFDGDKSNHFHPTKQYQVQVGWYERVWETCWEWDIFPYPCYHDEWRTAEKTVNAVRRTIDLRGSSLYGVANLLQQAMCGLGLDEISMGSGTVRLCDQPLNTVSEQFLPTLRFPAPYQSVEMPLNQWFTTYFWRFRTKNVTHWSAHTGWSSFYRSF